MSKLPVILIASALIMSSGMARAQSTDDNAAPAMTMKKPPATKDNTDANPAASAEKPAQPGGPSGTGAAAKTNGDTSK